MQRRAVSELLRVSPVADGLARRFEQAGHRLALVGGFYLPLSRLLNLYVGATHGLRHALNTFLGDVPDGGAAQPGTP